MQQFTDIVLDLAGNAVVGALVYVLNAQGAVAPLYSDNGVTSVANPLTTDSSGTYSFYAANGVYSLRVTRAGYSDKTVSGVFMNDLSVQQTATGGVSRAMSDEILGRLTVQQFDTVQNAVARAYSTVSPLYSTAGTIVTAANIPNLHDVQKAGVWAIQRGSSVFYVGPTPSQINTLYVSTTGSDANDGLDTTFPLATISRAMTILQQAGPALGGTWKIVLSAGTYSIAATDFAVLMANLNRIVIQGPIVGHPNVPTAILDGGGTIAYGLNFNSRAVATLSNIKLQNFTQFGIVAQDLADLTLVNVHVASVTGGPGVKVQQGRLRVQGGIISSCQTGISCIGNTVFTIGDPASASLLNGTQILNCTQQGILAQEQSSGHADFVTITNCAIGLDAQVHSRFHAQGCAITANTTAGVRCVDGSSWYDNGTSANFATNGVNELIYNANGEIGRDSTRTTWQRQPVDQAAVINTGNTTANVVKTYANAIGANSFNSSVKAYRMEVLATNNGVLGTKIVSVQIGGVTVCTFTVPAAALMFNLELLLTARNATTQRLRARAWTDTAYLGTVISSPAITTLTGAALPATITVQNSTASDQFQIIEVEQANAGGC